MIENITIQNFKSLNLIDIELGKFNCLIGMNGAGKSTILQALDFISHILMGDVQTWLDNRGWKVSELNCKLQKFNYITISVDFRLESGDFLTWLTDINKTHLRCDGETIFLNHNKILQSTGSQYRINDKPWQNIAFIYEGSLLSQLKPSELPDPIVEFLHGMRRIRSLELLSPHLMRKRARTNDQDIGSGGEKLSAYLHGIKGEARDRLIDLMKRFYPNLIDYKVSSLRSGWKKLTVLEQYGDRKLETEASHLSDGLLRILAILAQSESDHSLILLDEIENGINPEIIEKLVDTLVASPQQIIVTTHSPMILNYLTDEIARESVQFVYKTAEGFTRIRPFFEIPRIREKLRWMGPGEAFVDTNLFELTEECIALDVAEQSAGTSA
jgi:predicted ATPase